MNSQSLTTLQNMLDRVRSFGDIQPTLHEVSGYQPEPFVTICTDVYSDIVGVPFPHKWNEIKLPVFYSNSWQQDYALLNPDQSSVYNVEWLERGIVVDMTSTAIPRAWGYVECGRQLTQATGTFIQVSTWRNPTFLANWFPNYMLYYGTWGAGNTANPTTGNNPGPGSIYTAPLNAIANSQPNNPINQIIDPNGNLQVVTTYGTCGNVAPNWPPAGTAPGTNTPDGSTIWTVVDPNGVGIRILPVPSQTGAVFQFNLIAQKPAIRFTSLDQTLDPFPDKYESYFRQGIIAQCYRYSSLATVQAKFEKNYQIWLKSLNDLRAMEDRELEENRFVPEQGVMDRGGGGSIGAGWRGAAYPFPGPGQNW
jgi:hypothetical protein